MKECLLIADYPKKVVHFEHNLTKPSLTTPDTSPFFEEAPVLLPANFKVRKRARGHQSPSHIPRQTRAIKNT